MLTTFYGLKFRAHKEITFLLKVISVFGVISIITYLSFYEISTDLESALKLFTLGGYLLAYNTFIPYLTFPFISATYLSFSESSKINKIFYFIIAFFIFSYITISTSRQSIIYCIIAVLTFVSFHRKLFKNFSYKPAVKVYKTLLKVEPEEKHQQIKLKIAECYRMLNDPKNSEKWYAEVINDEGIDDVYKLHYAQSLSSNKKYKEAEQWFTKYQKAASGDDRPGKHLKVLSNLDYHFKDSSYYKT